MKDDVKDKQLTIVDDSDLALLNEAAHDLAAGDMVGRPLKYVKGVWSIKDGPGFLKVGDTQQFCVDMRSYQHGWIRWKDQKPTHRYMGRKVDNWPLPTRNRLPEADLEGPDDPWQETHSIVMRNLDADGDEGLCTYQTTSYGGRKALGKLIEEYVKQAKAHLGLMPIVYLGSIEKPSQQFGMVANPVITISDWMDFGPSASPPGRKITAVPIPQITYDDEETATEEQPSPKRSFDDEIPF
ncbi:MAG: hypothetical protein WCD69_25160 [Xanthobacteraceae bacterium]